MKQKKNPWPNFKFNDTVKVLAKGFYHNSIGNIVYFNDKDFEPTAIVEFYVKTGVKTGQFNPQDLMIVNNKQNGEKNANKQNV